MCLVLKYSNNTFFVYGRFYQQFILYNLASVMKLPEITLRTLLMTPFLSGAQTPQQRLHEENPNRNRLESNIGAITM